MTPLRAKAGAAWLLLTVVAAGVWLRGRRAHPPPALPPGDHGPRPADDAAQIDIVTVVDDLLGAAG
jgi:hypothetical protein